MDWLDRLCTSNASSKCLALYLKSKSFFPCNSTKHFWWNCGRQIVQVLFIKLITKLVLMNLELPPCQETTNFVAIENFPRSIRCFLSDGQTICIWVICEDVDSVFTFCLFDAQIQTWFAFFGIWKWDRRKILNRKTKHYESIELNRSVWV